MCIFAKYLGCKLEEENKTLKSNIDSLEYVIEGLEKELDKYEPNKDEEYWNNKYPKTTLTYKGRKMPGLDTVLDIDVRVFINPNDKTIPTFDGKDDEIMLKSLIWVIENITYTPDKTQNGLNEYWMFPYETLKTRKGDCEDGAILLYNIALKSGIPYWKLRLSAGNVKGGGHAYLTYLVEETNRWVVVDWCYWENKLPMNQRKDYKDEKNYYEVWFSWNQRYCFSKGLNTETIKLFKL